MRISDWSSDVCSSDLDLSRWVPRRTRLQTDRRRLRPRVYIAHTNIRGIRARSVPIRPQHRRRYQTDKEATEWRSKQRTTNTLQARRPIGITCSACSRRSEEHTSELQSLMRISYAVFCLKKKNTKYKHTTKITITIQYNTQQIRTSILHNKH